jgi:predicted enzyme related to lactoylglutathione lyase
MLADTKAFSGFAVDDVDAAKRFYAETLGLEVSVLDEEHGLITIKVTGGDEIFVYAKPDHAPANFTLLNFEVDDIDASVDDLSTRGVEFERYDGFDQDEKGIARGPGPMIAWFKDPAGNTLSVLQQP